MAWAGRYVGDGVATSNLAGRLLRNLILKQDEEINRLPIVNHHSPLWEREPLRWLGVNFGLTAAGIGDDVEVAVMNRVEAAWTHCPHGVDRRAGHTRERSSRRNGR